MQNYILSFLLSWLYLAILLGLSEWLQRRIARPAIRILCRKLVHIGTGFVWCILYALTDNTHVWLLFALVTGAAVMILCRTKTLRVISEVSERTRGIVYYVIAMVTLLLACAVSKTLILPFGMALCASCIGDGCGEMIGGQIRRCNPKILENKTLFGSVGVFLSTAGALWLFAWVYGAPLAWWHILLLAYVAAATELMSRNSTDNLTVPLAVAVVAWGMLYGDILPYLALILIFPAVSFLLLKKRALTMGGVVAANAVGFCMYAFGGWQALLYTALFYALAMVADRLKKEAKRAARQDLHQKSDCRDAAQVLANGAVASVALILGKFTNFGGPVVFAAVIAESLADTIASECGMLSRATPRNICTGRPVPKGLSGGITWAGTLAALGAAALFALLGFFLFDYSAERMVLVGFAAFVGCLSDSMMGALLQIKYRCPVCGMVTERVTHCNTPTIRHGGFPHINNDGVNFLSGLVAALVAQGCMFLIP